MGYFFTFFYLFIVYFVLTISKRLLNISGDITRKIMHVFSCMSVFLINYFYIGQVHMFIIPILYIMINWLIIRFNLFSIMQRDAKHYGGIYFSITLFISQLFVYFKPDLLIPSYYSLLVLAFGDGASGLFGSVIVKNFRLTKYKSLVGMISFILFSFISLLIADSYFLNIGFINLLVLAITGSVVELLTDNGLDNFTVYFLSLFIVVLMIV